jgi:hypothetical protein
MKVIHRLPNNLKGVGLTFPALAMPEVYRGNNSVKSYRDYYRGEKRNIATWTKRPIPEWMLKGD